MGSTFGIRAKLLARVVAPVLFATALSACSTVPDWVDPTTWIGGDSQSSSDETSDAGAATDQSTAAGTDQAVSPGQQAASTQPSGSGQTPDIAAIPPKPAPPSTADEQKQVADSLAADRAQAHYSADALRGGTESTAAPPSAESAAAPVATTSEKSAASASDAAAASNPTEQSASAETGAPSAGDQTAAPAKEAASAPPAPAANQVASADTASTSAPAAAPMAAAIGAPPTQSAPDMQASFAPSKAPALDPSVSQYVPQQILSHYQETAAAASVPVESSTATPARHRHHKKIKTSQGIIRLHFASRSGVRRMGMIRGRYAPGNNEEMLREAALMRASPSYEVDRALFTPASKPALAVVDFTHETTILDNGARNRIQSAARDFQASGGAGFMRVVGRASELEKDLPRAIRLRNNFERSEAQATAVARELIRDGVPPQSVLVEALGATPIGDHESAKTSRSAEIFLQS
jgi:hypothetical protein